MKRILLAEFTVLLERQFLLHLLLITLGIVRNTATLGALHLGHVFLNLAHKNKINMIQRVRTPLYVNFSFSSTLGAICRARTDDPRFTKPLLYQLS